MLTDLYEQPRSDGDLPETVPEIYLGTVVSADSSGVELSMDGESDALTKKYRQILTGRFLPVGARVAVLKTAGTYVVLGQIANPGSVQNPEDLAGGADLSAVISKTNEILTALRAVGVFLDED